MKLRTWLGSRYHDMRGLARFARGTRLSWTGAARGLKAMLVSAAYQPFTAADVVAAFDAPHAPDQVSPIALYADWRNDSRFQRFFAGYPPGHDFQSVLTHYHGKVDRMQILGQLCESAMHVPGNVAEYGVFMGHSALVMAELIARSGAPRRLFLFDSFRGMPPTTAGLDSFREGDFAETSLDRVRALFAGRDYVTLVPGFFSDTLPQTETGPLAFCHIDCDLYLSVRESIEYVYPRLSTGAIVVFDDYGFRTCEGARKAVDEFCQAVGRTAVYLPTGQAVLIKN